MIAVRSVLIAASLLMGVGSLARAQEPRVQTSQALNDQWFTGPLAASSPALPKAGLFALEPYIITTLNTGKYLADGHHVGGSNQSRNGAIFALVEYGITDRLSIQALPQINYGWNDQTTTRGAVASDLPIDLKYRFVNQVVNTAIPSATVSVGVSFPTGPFDKLGSRLEESGSGSGVYYARQGGTLQWLFNTWDNHPLRVRLWGSLQEPLNHPTVRDVSVYGTTPGFLGRAKPGITATVGISPEYALTQRWVLAADIFRSYADATSVSGTDFNGNPFSVRPGSRGSWAVAPAVEYNWSSQYGVIAGVQLNFAGHNTSSYVAPQIALNIVF